MGADAIVIRHSSSGSPLQLTQWVDGHVLNAGDGTHEHPTQALLDLYTMREKLGRLEGLRVAIVGDVLHSRVARSLSFGLVKMGAEVTLIGPPTLIPPEAPAWGVQVSYDLDGVLPKLDVCYMLRVQRERQRLEYFPSVREYARLFGLTRDRAAHAARGRADHAPRPDEPRRRDRLRRRRPAAGGDRGAGDERHRDPDVAAVPAARRRRRGEERADELSALFLRGARVVDPPAGATRCATSLVADGRIAADAPAGAERDRRATGLLLAPGLVDLHTHLREPGYEHKETIATGTAGRGRRRLHRGRRRWPTPIPWPTTPASSPRSRDVAAGGRPRATCSRSAPSRRASPGSRSPRWARWSRPASGCSATTASCVPTPRMLRNALTYAKAFPVEVVIADHCEDASLVEGGQMHEGVTPRRSGLAGRPAEAEEIIVARDLAIARMTGGRLHLCHVSSARAVELIRRAKAEGVRVTAEVTPHHLVFTDDDLVTYDTNLKVHPPLRTAEDREALRTALADGTIDAVATDHAPHAVEEKEAEFDLAPPGTIGLETALAAVLTHLVEPGVLSLARARSRP